MGTRRITIEVDLPEGLLLLRGVEERIAPRVREAVVMDLLRDGLLSQGRAAELLGVDRWRLVDIMNAHEVPFFNITDSDLAEEVRQLSAWELGAPPNLTRKDYYEPDE